MDYKEKVRLAKEALESGSYDKETIEYIFPELAESEDERIRKELIIYLRSALSNKKYGDKFIESWIAWLEKLEIKEHNVCDTCDEKASCVNPCPMKLVEQKPADKVDQHSLPVSDNSSLPTFDESIYHPCTEGVYEQTPTKWSEEDESCRNTILCTVQGKFVTEAALKQAIAWLKSLKDRYTWKPSEEQMLAINTAINVIGEGTLNGKQLIELQEQLIKLRGE